LDELAYWLKEETGYQWIQGTKPQTLSFALTDSPAGLAAWIIEKFRTWSDCNGDVESAFTRDQLLANISLYWLTPRSAPRSFLITSACIGHGRSRRAGQSMFQPATASSRAKSCVRHARSRNAPTPISAAGP